MIKRGILIPVNHFKISSILFIKMVAIKASPGRRGISKPLSYFAEKIFRRARNADQEQTALVIDVVLPGDPSGTGYLFVNVFN